jgi:hypothetical protein
MNALKHIRAYLLVCSLVVVLQPFQGLAQQNSAATRTALQHAPTERDGQHDFDFEIGTWKTHLKRLLHPLAGSTTWVEYEGTTVVRKVWNGRANLLELEADGPAGHFEGLNLRLYNPQSHQWSLNFANSNSGAISQPTIGEFKNGRGEFFDQETLNGRAIFVRFVISDITPNSTHFEQSFSDDGGKTWEVNWIATDTRVDTESVQRFAQQNTDAVETSVQLTPAERDGQHGFDFEIGAWKIHLKRLEHRLTGSTTWIEFDGTSVTRRVWDGRADLEEFEVDSPTGHIEGMTLRLYDPQTHQWSLYWATSKSGTLGQPTIGEFKNGRGEFFDTEPSGPNGRAILVRFVWSDITPNSAHFEQSFSDDGGKTWEVNWITDQTRVKDESVKAH